MTASWVDPAPIPSPRVRLQPPITEHADSETLFVSRVDSTGPLLAVADSRFVGARCLAVAEQYRAGLARGLLAPGRVLARAD